MAQFWFKQGTPQRQTDYQVRLLGVGAGAPTKEEGDGITVTRTGAGVYRLTWADNPYQYLGVSGIAKIATTMSGLKNFDVTFGDYTASGTSYTLDFTLWNGAGAATDLAAAQRLSFVVSFAQTGY